MDSNAEYEIFETDYFLLKQVNQGVNETIVILRKLFDKYKQNERPPNKKLDVQQNQDVLFSKNTYASAFNKTLPSAKSVPQIIVKPIKNEDDEQIKIIKTEITKILS